MLKAKRRWKIHYIKVSLYNIFKNNLLFISFCELSWVVLAILYTELIVTPIYSDVPFDIFFMTETLHIWCFQAKTWLLNYGQEIRDTQHFHGMQMPNKQPLLTNSKSTTLSRPKKKSQNPNISHKIIRECERKDTFKLREKITILCIRDYRYPLYIDMNIRKNKTCSSEYKKHIHDGNDFHR